jgi:mono/diheme cytochrome c family protein
MRRLLIVLALLANSAAPAFAQDGDAVAAGQTLYADKCSECHGPRLRNPGTAFDLKKLHADERPRFEKAVLDGKGQMPPWRGVLSSAQLDQLWAYIREYAYE